MWEYEHSIETDAAPAAIWRLWADVPGWGAWNAEIESVELSGPFAAGSRITMTPPGEDPIRLLVAEAVEGERFVDEARFGDLLLWTLHLVEPVDGGRTRVTYRMEITGAGSDQAGPEIGPGITADWPDTMASLVRLALS